MAEIRVVNIRDYIRGGKVELPENAVYVGRDVNKYGLKASPLANPYREGQTREVNLRSGDDDDTYIDNPDGVMGRADVIEAYSDLLAMGFAYDELARLRDLAAKGPLLLACWCAPKPCHGDVIVETLREMLKGERP
jgi:hypothetical protein